MSFQLDARVRVVRSADRPECIGKLGTVVFLARTHDEVVVQLDNARVRTSFASFELEMA